MSDDRTKRIAEFHERLLALIRANVHGLPGATAHDLACEVALSHQDFVMGDKSAPSDKELLAALNAGAPKYLPKVASPAERLDPAAAHVAQKARDWEKAVGTPPTPEMRLAWAREAPTYKFAAKDKPQAETTNNAVADAMARYERATGRSRHELHPSQQIEIARKYALMDAAPLTPTIDDIARTGRQPSPMERRAMQLEAEALPPKDAA